MSGVIGKYGEFFKIGGVLMKKFLAIVTSAVLGLVMAITPVYAGTNNNKDRAFSDTVQGQLISDNGDIIYITGYKDTKLRSLANNDNEQTVTYKYLVPMSTFSHNHSVSGSDSTGYISATVTIYYTENNAYAPSEYLLTRVSGIWRDPNPNDGTSVSNTAHIKANCSGAGHTNQWKTQIKEGDIKSGTSLYTGFNNSIYSTNGSLGAYFSLRLSQGSSRSWNLNLQCFAF